MSMCYYNLVKNYKKAIMNSQHISGYFVPITQFYLLAFNNSDLQIQGVTKVGRAKLTNTYIKAKNRTLLYFIFFLSLFFFREIEKQRKTKQFEYFVIDQNSPAQNFFFYRKILYVGKKSYLHTDKFLSYNILLILFKATSNMILNSNIIFVLKKS